MLDRAQAPAIMRIHAQEEFAATSVCNPSDWKKSFHKGQVILLLTLAALCIIHSTNPIITGDILMLLEFGHALRSSPSQESNFTNDVNQGMNLH